MKKPDEFFSNERYLIFGSQSKGRMHGKILIAALQKSGKTAVLTDVNDNTFKNAEYFKSITDAGNIDGAIILPPTPWNSDAANYTKAKIEECITGGITDIWIYADGDPQEARAIAESFDPKPITGKCPCLYIKNAGFPHNIHQTIARWLKQL